MSIMFSENREERERAEREYAMYHRIMREGVLDRNGYLVKPPEDMSDEEQTFYEELLRKNGGKLQYTV